MWSLVFWSVESNAQKKTRRNFIFLDFLEAVLISWSEFFQAPNLEFLEFNSKNSKNSKFFQAPNLEFLEFLEFKAGFGEVELILI